MVSTMTPSVMTLPGLGFGRGSSALLLVRLLLEKLAGCPSIGLDD